MFDKLDESTLFNKFDSLDLGELADLAVNQRYQKLINKYFTVRELHHGKLSIIASEKTENTELFFVAATENYRHVRNATGHAAMFATLKSFCHLFNELSITTYDIHSTYLTRQITNTVNNYCSNTKQEIRLAMNHYTKETFVYENATIVYLRSIQSELFPTLATIFPRMERLAIRMIYNRYTASSIKIHLPHLKHIEFEEKTVGIFNWKTFAKHNPQITSIRIKTPWMPEYFRLINELFPKLETLDIGFLGYNHMPPPTFWADVKSWLPVPSSKPTGLIKFDNVKHMTVELVDLELNSTNELEHIVFEKLESYTFKASPTLRFDKPGQIDLITRNSKLIDVDLQYPFDYEQTVRLVEELPMLQKLAVECTNIETVNGILKIMEMDSHLAMISVDVRPELREQFLQMSDLIGKWTLRSNPAILEQRLVFM